MQPNALLRDRRGYSIGELLWVMVILSILTALVIPKLDWMRYRVNAEIRNVTLQLTYAQRLAVSLQHNVQVTIDHTSRRLIVDEDANNDGNYSSGERRRVIQLEDGVNFERNAVVTLPAPSPTNEVTQVIYRRDGSADRTGVIYVNSQRDVNLNVNKDARVLEIVRATGRAFWYRYDAASSTWTKGN